MNNIYKNHIKRLLDILIAGLTLLLFWWLILLLALLVKLDSAGPAFFCQKRIGKDGRVFTMVKLRTMVVGAEGTGSGVYSDKTDARVTRLGRLLRATSLDELPQVWNMLKGDMSLIGPRPPLTYHPWPWENYTAEQKKMFTVRPGLTGWAQINGRRAVEWNRRIELNNWYVDHCSFALDLKIFLRTFLKVLSNADNENLGETVTKSEEPSNGRADSEE